MNSRLIYIDGDFRASAEVVGLLLNRAFQYGDGIFETMRHHQPRTLFLAEHVKRLHASMRFMQLQADERVDLGAINQAIQLLCTKNELSDARIRLQVFRAQGGYYHPRSSDYHVLITCEPLMEQLYPMPTKSVSVNIYPYPVKVLSPHANLKSLSAAGYVLASIHAQNTGFDDSLVLNSAGRVCESTHSNIFIYKNNVFHTPPLIEGCVAGIMRDQVITLISKSNHTLEERPLEIQDVETAEEILLTNSIRGISSVGRFGESTYPGEKAEQMQSLLNARVFN